MKVDSFSKVRLNQVFYVIFVDDLLFHYPLNLLSERVVKFVLKKIRTLDYKNTLLGSCD